MKKIIILIKILFINMLFVKTGFSATYQLFTPEIPPYVEKNGGLAIDIVKALFNRAKQPIGIRAIPLSRAIHWTKVKKHSCVVPIQRSQERETSFKWVGPVLITQSAIFSRSDDSIKIDVFKDAFNYKIMVARGSADEEYLKGFGALTEVANDDLLNASKLKNKRARLWAADTIIAPYYAKKVGINIKQQLVIITTLRAIACNINTPDELISHLNEVLSSMYQDGTIRKIYDKYRYLLDIKGAFTYF